MIKTYRINQIVIFGGKTITFDINLEESKLSDFISKLEGKITVWEQIQESKGDFLENLPKKSINYFKVKFPKYTVTIKGYKGNMYFNEDERTISKFIAENTACKIKGDKPKEVISNSIFQ